MWVEKLESASTCVHVLNATAAQMWYRGLVCMASCTLVAATTQLVWRIRAVLCFVVHPYISYLIVQLEAMAKTAILITPCGGTGTVLTFLPPGATAIIFNYWHDIREVSVQMESIYYWYASMLAGVNEVKTFFWGIKFLVSNQVHGALCCSNACPCKVQANKHDHLAMLPWWSCLISYHWCIGILSTSTLSTFQCCLKTTDTLQIARNVRQVLITHTSKNWWVSSNNFS